MSPDNRRRLRERFGARFNTVTSKPFFLEILPAIKEMADWITTRSNEEDGVAEAVERFILKVALPVE